MRPFYGYVWFDGSDTRRAAAIYGTTNGWAVAVMEWPDARDLLVASGMTVTHRANKLIVRHDGAIDEIPVIGRTAMALFDGSWALLHEKSDWFKQDPEPLPAAWRRRVNFD